VPGWRRAAGTERGERVGEERPLLCQGFPRESVHCLHQLQGTKNSTEQHVPHLAPTYRVSLSKPLSWVHSGVPRRAEAPDKKATKNKKTEKKNPKENKKKGEGTVLKAGHFSFERTPVSYLCEQQLLQVAPLLRKHRRQDLAHRRIHPWPPLLPDLLLPVRLLVLAVTLTPVGWGAGLA